MARAAAWPVGAILAVLSAIAAGAVANTSTPTAPSPALAQESGPTVPGELLVRFKSGVSPAQQEAYLQERGLALGRRHFVPEYVTVRLPAGGNEAALLNEIVGDDVVDSVDEIPLQFPLDAPEPNDPWFYAQRWNFSLVQAQEAWEHTRGAGVIVAVIDTGVAFENYQSFKRGPDFEASQFVYPRNEFDGTSHPNDDWGHGTHISGTVAEATDNGLEAAGIASDALILPVKACGWVVARDRYGCPVDVVADAIDWATTHGADVINLSLGGTDPRIDLEREAIERALSAGIVVVAASGNGGPDRVGDPQLYYPAALPGVIAVGGADSTGVRADYSNYGSSPQDPARILDLVAPGGSAEEATGIVQNTYADFCVGKSPPVIDVASFATCAVRGTSQAAAHVSAVAALILSLRPDLPGAAVRELLQCSALDVGDLGTDAEHGYGLVQAGAAIRDSDGNGTFDCLEQPEDACGVVAGLPTPTAAGIVAQGMPTPVTTPTPSPSPTPTPTPTPTPSDTPTPTPTDTPTPTATPSPSATATPTVTPSAVACGDVDCDYDVDSVDALGILRYVAQLSEPACIDKGYTNCDSFITAVDALFILRYVAAIPNGGGEGCPVIGYE